VAISMRSKDEANSSWTLVESPNPVKGEGENFNKYGIFG